MMRQFLFNMYEFRLVWFVVATTSTEFIRDSPKCNYDHPLLLVFFPLEDDLDLRLMDTKHTSAVI